MSKFCILAMGDSITMNGAHPGYFYQAMGVQAGEIYSESDAPRRAWRGYPTANVIAANYALSQQTIAYAEGLSAELALMIPSGYTAVSGRPERHYIQVLRMNTNPVTSDPVAAASRTRDYCLSQQANGWKMVLCPITSGYITGAGGASADTAYIQPYNAIIANWTASDGVAAVVSSADAVMYGTEAYKNLTYFNDQNNPNIGLHPTLAGHTRLKNDLVTTLNTLIDSLGGGTPLS